MKYRRSNGLDENMEDYLVRTSFDALMIRSIGKEGTYDFATKLSVPLLVELDGFATQLEQVQLDMRRYVVRAYLRFPAVGLCDLALKHMHLGSDRTLRVLVTNGRPVCTLRRASPAQRFDCYLGFEAIWFEAASIVAWRRITGV